MKSQIEKDEARSVTRVFFEFNDAELAAAAQMGIAQVPALIASELATMIIRNHAQGLIAKVPLESVLNQAVAKVVSRISEESAK